MCEMRLKLGKATSGRQAVSMHCAQSHNSYFSITESTAFATGHSLYTADLWM